MEETVYLMKRGTGSRKGFLSKRRYGNTRVVTVNGDKFDEAMRKAGF